MSHILLISHNASIPKSLRAALTAPELRIIAKSAPEDARSALERGTFDLCIIYAEASDAKLSRQLQAIHQSAEGTFTIVISPEYSLEQEQTAFEHHADLYFAEPLPMQSLQRLITRKEQSHSAPAITPAASPTGCAPQGSTRSTSSLHILRDFSNILGFSLDYKAFTQHFILKLREHISISRIGIFLEASAKQSIVKDRGYSHLECVASLGLPSDLIDCFQLSREVGIGKSLHEQPRVLSIHEAATNPSLDTNGAIRKEFGILGCQLAVPISDREGPIGVAVLSGPVTGREFTEDELELLYLLMEELGLAIRNSRLHKELGRHGALIENVLSSMASGAIVVSEDLEILYANRAAKRFLQIDENETRAINFAELPNTLAGPVHRAVEKGELSDAFIVPDSEGNRIYQISIFPFTHNEELALLPRPTMVMIEDFTKIEATKQTALDNSKSELISLIAERFAHEIRNSLVPLTTHMQLIDKKIKQPAFQASLKSALQKETGRIKRFSEQMLYLAQNSNSNNSKIDVEGTLLSSFEVAKKQSKRPDARISIGDVPKGASIEGNSESIAYALEELFLNAIQASEDTPTIHAKIQHNDEGILTITLRDNGPGFSKDSLEHATEPFYTSRNTGVGLGLSVAKKIIETHNGYLTLNQRNENKDWDIQIELPTTLDKAAQI
ncbi:MAG: ATP-binding protein [Opitutaceae bacterium]